MREIYHKIARESKTAPEFVQNTMDYFKSLGEGWQNPKRQDLYLFYRMNGY